MQSIDINGQIVTADADQSERMDEVILGLAGLKLKAAEAADGLPAEMPDVPMAHIIRASIYLMGAEAAAQPELRASLNSATALHARANSRERMHMAALSAWAEGDFCAAAESYGALSDTYPHDLLALQLGQQTDFFTGRQRHLRDRIARAIGHWGEGQAGFSHVLGMLAFGLEENGDYAAAEATGRRAVESDPSDSWAVHAVAHVMEMQGRTAEGMAWLNQLSAHWSPGNILAYHNWWHLGLFHLEYQRWDEALAVYDTHVARGPGAPALELVDAAALLWRLHLQGVDVTTRAATVAEGWDQVLAHGIGFYAFNEMHAAFARVAAGRVDEGERHLAALKVVARGSSPHARLVADLGIPLVSGIYALGAGRADAALALLGRAAPMAMRLGGSNAQRDVIALTMAAAAEQSGDDATLSRLALRRLEAKPESPLAWGLLRRAQEGLAA